MDKLVKHIFQNSIVKITGSKKLGTGVFISPGVILTCQHVLEKNSKIFYKSHTLQIDDKKEIKPDVLLIFVNFTDHPFVPLNKSENGIIEGDTFIIFGYTRDYPNGEGLSLTYESIAYDENKHLLLKFANGQVVQGFSGSPLLNTRTGYVCGIIKSSRNPQINLGGRGIPSHIILSKIDKDEVKKPLLQSEYTLTNNEEKIQRVLRDACKQQHPEDDQSLLEKLLRILELPDNEALIERGVWYLEVAKKLNNISHRKIQEIVKLIFRYKNDERLTLSFLAALEASWVNEKSANLFCEVATVIQENKATGINAKDTSIAKYYAQKAEPINSEPWEVTSILNRPGENYIEGLINEITDELRSKFYLEPEDDLRVILEKKEVPIVLSVPGYFFDDILLEVRHRFPTLTLFFVDKRSPTNGIVQIGNTAINLMHQGIHFLEPPLKDDEFEKIKMNLEKTRAEIINLIS